MSRADRPTRKTKPELEAMREAGRVVAGALDMLEERLKPGVSTAELDTWAEEHIRSQGAVP
ncbi:MAG TPA: M24 family metallopeptidase, partial [Armatimonadota bacterium]|nr:M24 family metallopeptidase [Armatimonadota bacterium]